MDDLAQRIADLSPGKRELLSRRLAARASRPPAASPARRRASDPLVLSFAQQRLCFIAELESGNVSYNIGGGVALRGPLDPAALAAALDEIRRRHETLRTTFPTADGRAFPLISPPSSFPLARIDFSRLPPVRRRREVEWQVGAALLVPFDLAAGPLVRSWLFSGAPGESYFAYSLHHVVADGWSESVLVRELAVLYDAFRRGLPSPLPELSCQYTDYALWQRDLATRERLAGSLGYWRAKLSAGPPELDLATDFPRPAELSPAGSSRPWRLPPRLAGKLRELARRRRTTLFTVLSAGFRALLFRHTAQEAFGIGTPVAGRERRELEDLIGLFVNTLVLHTPLAGDATFSELLAREHETVLGAQTHQSVPFELLVREAGAAGRSLSRTALFQVSFSLDATPALTAQVGELSIAPLELTSGAVQFELSLTLRDLGGEIAGALEYSTELFTGTTVERLLGHFATLLAAAASAPDEPVEMLALLDAAERQQLVVEWNDTDRRRPGEECLHQLVERQAARTPSATAVVCAGATTSYRDLDRRANALARRLLAAGARVDAPVAVLAERSLDMVVALLAVLKAGAAFLPLDHEAPRARLAFQLADAHPAAVLTQPGELASLAREIAAGTPVLDLLADAEGAGDATPLAALPLSGAHLAYVLYTSGSTGQPKAVMVPHAGIVNRLLWMQEAYRLEAADRVLQKTPFTFDVSVWEFFWPLMTGARLVMAPPGAHRDAPWLASLVAAEAITTLHFVPSMLGAFLDAPGVERCVSLRRVMASGEALSSPLVETFHQRFGGRAELHNLYGPTEASVDVSSWVCAAGGVVRDAIPIGRPIANLALHVLGQSLEPVPLGACGELFLGGVGLARGYLGRGDLTAERFVPDPTARAPGARLYRTGDRARRLADGAVVFLGRLDHQVKLRGVRIELGEIEAVLEAHPRVREAVVALREEAGRAPYLAAYLVARGEGAVQPRELREHLSGQLSDAMIPAVFVLLEELPRGATGKVDRRALPAPVGDGLRAGAEFRAPRPGAEERLAEIWRPLLGVEQIGRDDDFFTLGGDSILGLQMVARARAAGLALTTRQVFQRPTLEGLAALAAASAPHPPSPRHGALQAAGGPLPLSPIQRWFFAELGEDSHHFNQSLLLDLSPEVRAADLARALAGLVATHASLRLRFRAGDAAWGARAGDAVAPHLSHLSIVDLAGVGAAAVADATTAVAAALQGSLDLESGPLLRTALLELGPGRGRRLFLVVHHLGIDGVSWGVLLDDLELALSQASRGARVVLPPPPTPVSVWLAELAVEARSSATREEAPFWLAGLEGTPAGLPRDGRGANRAGSAETLSLSFTPAETAGLLHARLGAERVSPEVVLLTAVARAMAPWTARDELRVDLEGHGRDPLGADLDLSRTVGWLTCLYPMVVVAGADAGPETALRANRERLSAVPRGGIGYGLLAYLGEDAELASRLRRSGSSEVLFNYQGIADRALAGSRWLVAAAGATGTDVGPRFRRRHAIEIECAVIGGCLESGWTFSRDLYRRSTVERLAERFLAELRALLAPGVVETPSVARGRLAPAGRDAGAAEAPSGVQDAGDAYPLTPMQQGMLFHTLLAPRSEVFFDQTSCALRGELDVGAFRRAWQEVVDRHPILRTGFLWEGVDEPVQVVQPGLGVPWREEDWSGLDAREQRERFADLLSVDRREGFDLRRAPLLRLALVRCSQREHRFLWSHHHILLDGWSQGLVIGEVFAFYRAFTRGERPELPAPRPFRDYVAWLRAQDRGAAKAFWKSALAGWQRATPLPGRRRGPPEATGEDAAGEAAYAEMGLSLGRSSTAALTAFARWRGLTLNTLLQGAWALVLGRAAGEREVVFGSTVAGRPAQLAGVEGMVGLFINALPVRVALPASEPVGRWLAGLQERQAEAREHEQAPLAEIQRWAGAGGGESLFSTLLNFESYPAAEASRAEIEIEELAFRNRPNYPLVLAVSLGAELRVLAKYDSWQLTSAAVLRSLEQLRRMLAALPEAADRCLAHLVPLSEAERHQLLAEWNDTAVAIAWEVSWREVLSGPARVRADAVALDWEGCALTYGELHRRADLLASILHRRGVGAEDRVAVLLPRGVHLVTALLAVWKAGGAFIALAPGGPPERLLHVLREARPRLVLVCESTRSELPEVAGPALRVDDEGGLRPERAAPFSAAGGHHHLAYIAYTSGSTGLPKGALIPRRGLLSYFAFLREVYRLDSRDTVLQLAPTTFDAAVRDTLAPLIAGARLVLTTEDEARDPAAILASIRDRSVTCLLSVVPTLLRGLVEAADAGHPTGDSLRLVLSSGEALRVRESAAMRRAFGPALWLVNQYGATECTLSSTWCAANGAAEGTGALPLGRPIFNSRVMVLDGSLQVAPIGAAGEVFISGPGLARGYLDRPDLTAASFLPDPYSAEAGMRLYRLGDVARWRTDGTLEHLGRADRQVKVRGVRVEPEEVEAVLRRHPAVRAAAVVARPDPAGELELVAFLETADGAEPVVKEIEQHCAGHLPAAMMPAAFVSLPALPRSAHGKIDRQVLCNWQFARGPRLGRHRPPRGDTEKRLAELLSQLLEVAPVGAEDRFVDLGGHSVSAIRLTSRIKREFGIDLPLRLVFELQTVAAIAAELDSRRGAAVAPAIAVADRRGRRMRRSALGAEG